MLHRAAKLAMQFVMPRSLIVWRARGRNRPVALTFDDGPDPERTPAVLAALADADVRATFFLIGELAEKHPKLVSEIARAGHEIANHSYSHKFKHEMATLAEVGAEVERCNRVLQEITGELPRLYRPPYGSLSVDLFRYCRRTGTRIVLWSYDTRDFSDRPATPQEMDDAVVSGDIVLLHDSHAPSAGLVSGGVPLLKQRGLRIGRVSDALSS